MSILRVASWIVPALWLASLATASGNEASAHRLYEKGQAAYVEGRYAEAAARFQEAFKESPKPRLLWNLGQALRKLYDASREEDDLRHAAEAFEDYVELASTDEERRDARAAHEEAMRRLDALTPPPIAAPVPPSLVAPPPSRVIERTTTTETVTITTPAPHSLAPAFALMGVGVAIAGVGLVLGLTAENTAANVQGSGTPEHPVPFANVADTDSRGRAEAITSYVLYGVGAATVAAGLTLLLLPKKRSGASAWIAPAVGGMVLGGSF